MANIVVSAAACRVSGVLSIYKQFLSHLEKHIAQNKYYIFVHESMPQPPIPGVKYIVVDITRWATRIRFDHYHAKQILEKMGVYPDLIISLQNTALRCYQNVRHIIYYQQSLPFFSQKWNPFRKDERALFLYKNIYPYFVKSSIKGVDVDFVVQIPFIADGVEKKFKIEKNKIHVLFPDVETVNSSVNCDYRLDADKFHFFFPAIAAKYKGHKKLFDALKLIKQDNHQIIDKIQLHLTVDEKSLDMGEYVRLSGLEANVIFHGVIPQQQLLAMMNCCHGLLFPSTIETLGLPLIEGGFLGLPIAVSDVEYAHQVLGDYAGALFVSPNDIKSWAAAIVNMCKKPAIRNERININKESSWDTFFELVV